MDYFLNKLLSLYGFQSAGSSGQIKNIVAPTALDTGMDATNEIIFSLLYKTMWNARDNNAKKLFYGAGVTPTEGVADGSKFGCGVAKLTTDSNSQPSIR